MNHHSRWRFTPCSAECVEGARAYVGDGREVGVTALPSLISPPTLPSPPRSIYAGASVYGRTRKVVIGAQVHYRRLARAEWQVFLPKIAGAPWRRRSLAELVAVVARAAAR